MGRRAGGTVKRAFLGLLLLASPARAVEPTKILALRPADGEIHRRLDQSRWPGFVRERLAAQGWRLEIGPRGEQPADVEVEVTTLPAPTSLAALTEGLPVELGGARVTFAGRPYSKTGTVAAFRLPRPACPTCQRWLVVGDDPAELADFAFETALRGAGLQRRRSSPPPPEIDYQIRESPWLERTGRWRRTGEIWGVDAAAELDQIGRRDAEFARLVVVEGTPADTWVRLLVPPERSREPALVGLARTLDASARTMAARIPVTLETPLSVALEPDHETQGRNTGDVDAAVLGGPADLHLVWRPEDIDAYRVALAEALLARAGLGSGLPWLRAGAALWLAGDWYGRPYREWLPHLAAAEVLPTAAELLATEEQQDSSRPLWAPVAAAWVERLPGTNAREKLARIPGEPITRAVLERLARERAPAVSRRVPAPERFLAGVSFAHDNSLEGGYHAAGSGTQLDRLAALGADAVALMPFGYQRNARKPELGFLNRGATSENDAGMVHAARLARAKGFAVLWKPHLWISYGSWPGEVEMESEADWRAWWRTYRRFIVHHALLAEWAGSDLFSVGVELDRTVTREDDWGALIAAVRQFYSGPVTYAANWGEGSENVRFWRHLDVAGVDAYYPLAPREATTIGDEDLARGAREVVARLAAIAERSRLPLVLTEVGFPARRAAWIDPHDENGELNEADQERAYRALLPALQGRPWLRGAFFWKAFSGRRGDPPGRADFQFLGRPAERWVSLFWRAEKGAS